jgi:5-methyltetrahydrofolate--homocysteine methyltransferase
MISGVGEPVPNYQWFDALYDFSTPPEKIIDLVLKHFASSRFYGDAYHAWFPNFGPGALTAMVGGKGHLMPNTVWFDGGSLAHVEPEDLTLRFNPEAPWTKRIAAITAEAAKHDLNEIVAGQTDIGGASDILASFRHGEAYMFDLFDRPDTVKRLMQEIHTAWHECFQFYRGLLGADYPYSYWSCTLSQRSHAMLQADVSYMISPQQFGEFVLPELQQSCKKLERGFYHLDGKGELPHLDQILSIKELAGVQWVPGAGAPPLQEWPEVLNKIADSGKKLQLIGPIDQVAKALKVVRNLNAVCVFAYGEPQDMAIAEKMEAEYCR